MEEKQKEFINDVLYRRFLLFADSSDACQLADALTDEVADDIMGTADSDNWHSGDVEMALVRVLKNRLTE